MARTPMRRRVRRKTRGVRRFYERVLGPLLDDGRKSRRLLAATGALFVLALLLAIVRAVPLKMLPFDNKNEFQVLLQTDEGTTLERTDAIARSLAEVLRRAPEVKDFEVTVGAASPIDFNGLVRHYFLRSGANVADIRVNLAGKRERVMQSHEIALRLRPELEAVAARAGARIALVEVPPGPPVLATVVAEVVGGPAVPYARLREAAGVVADRLRAEPLVSDVDTTVEADQTRVVFVTDQEKAALSGVSSDDVARTVSLALGGLDASILHEPGEVNPLPIRLRLSRADRSGVDALQSLIVKGRPGIAKVREASGTRDAPVPIVRLGELGSFDPRIAEKAIYHKDLERVAYVYAEPVGRPPAEVIADVGADLAPAPRRSPPVTRRRRRSSRARSGGAPSSPTAVASPGRCRPVRRCAGMARASGRSRSRCSAIWGSPSVSRCSASTAC